MTKSAVRTRKRVLSFNNADDTVTTGGTCYALHSNIRLETRYVPPGELKPPKRILRKHSDRQVKLIGASITEHGFVNPILVNSDNQIVSGYGRWLAATALGMSQVPVIEISHLSSEQLRIYAIGDNRIAEQSEFDLDELRIELKELEGLDLDLKLELTGFATSGIDDLLGVTVTEAADPVDDATEVQAVAITRLGDLYQLGDHRLICGNSLEAATFDVLLGDEKAGMVFADAPYNLSSKTISGMGKHKHSDFAMAAGEMSVTEFTEFLATSFRRLVEYSVDGSIHFQCMDWRHMGEMLAAGKTEYNELKNLVVYAKPSAGMGTFYRSQHELIFVWKNGTASHVNNFGLGDTGRFRSNLWSAYKGNSGFHRDRDKELASHPTVKPWSLVADAIRDCSKRGAIILDPFGGAGTTLIAAERTRRKARLIELDPLYCDVTIRRWEKLTGCEAVLSATGQTFAELAEERGIDVVGAGDHAQDDIDCDDLSCPGGANGEDA